eukprot:UN21850
MSVPGWFRVYAGKKFYSAKRKLHNQKQTTNLKILDSIP